MLRSKSNAVHIVLAHRRSRCWHHQFRPAPNFVETPRLAPNDIAVISLAQPITTISPVTIAGLVPAPGTVLVSAGYGVNGTGTNCCNPIDNKRRNMTIEFGAYHTPVTQAAPSRSWWPNSATR